ncbi:hypothetical protein FB451DRAFT_1465763 [Mycena latifolia]|nr:hypothetical protein FB451DRAFT_1465763 [Mycena latifolia]
MNLETRLGRRLTLVRLCTIRALQDPLPKVVLRDSKNGLKRNGSYSGNSVKFGDVLALASDQKATAFWLGLGFGRPVTDLALAWPGIFPGQSQKLPSNPAKSHGFLAFRPKPAKAKPKPCGLASDFGKPKPWLSGQAKARTSLVKLPLKFWGNTKEGFREVFVLIIQYHGQYLQLLRCIDPGLFLASQTDNPRHASDKITYLTAQLLSTVQRLSAHSPHEETVRRNLSGSPPAAPSWPTASPGKQRHKSSWLGFREGNNCLKVQPIV